MTRKTSDAPRLLPQWIARLLLWVAALALLPATRGDIIWSGGTNTVLADTTQHDPKIVITGGTNSVQGAAGPPAGTNAGVLQVDSGGTGLAITGSTLTLNSDATKPGILSVMGGVTSHASATTSFISTGGNATLSGVVDCSTGTRTFTVEPGSVPGNNPDLSISALIRNAGVRKEGAGVLALSGANTYTGGTTLNAGKIFVNNAAAIGKGPFTVSAAGTSIDNTTGSPITLANNNQFNLTGGDLNFLGSADLNLGTGIFILFNSPSRTVTVANAAATLTIGGVVADNGSGVALNKAGPGTLALLAGNIYAGGTSVSEGTLHVASTAQTGAGTVTVGVAGTLIADGGINGSVSVSGVLGGTGTIGGGLTVNNGGIVDLNGGTLTVNGAITNNGLFVLGHGSQLAGVTSFVNNGTLDLTTAGNFTPPPNFTNNGTIIDSSVVKVKDVSRSGSAVMVKIDSYTGHDYQLRRYSSLTTNTFNDLGSQPGTTGTVLALTDSSPPGGSSFYRVVVDP
jgi:autotransporter-associated beta strand protein